MLGIAALNPAYVAVTGLLSRRCVSIGQSFTQSQLRDGEESRAQLGDPMAHCGATGSPNCVRLDLAGRQEAKQAP